MKNIFYFSLLLFCVSPLSLRAQNNSRSLELIGLGASELQAFAIVEVVDRGAIAVTNHLALREGEGDRGVEVLSIDFAKETVDILENRSTNTLKFRLPSKTEAGQPQAAGIVPGFHLQHTAVETVLKLYQQMTGRILLQHPQIKAGSLTLIGPAGTASQVATVLEQGLKLKGIAAIPDGERFVILVPAALTNSVQPGAASLPAATEPPIAAGMIDFRGANLRDVMKVYASFIGSTLTNPDDLPRDGTIVFRATTPLSRNELRYALETLFKWSGVEIVSIDGKSFKVAPTTQK